MRRTQSTGAGAGTDVRGPERDNAFLTLLRALLRWHHDLIARDSDGRVYLPAGSVVGLADLELRWREVLAEFEALDRERNALDFEEVMAMDLGVNGTWRGHFLIDRGQVLPAGSDRCPLTVALLQQVAGAEGACFSIMGPGAHLLPHKGPNKSILRAHLPLRVPDRNGSAALTVEGATLEHQPGQAFVFDDTFEHEAWNNGTSDRVTLMIDIRRTVQWWLRPLDTLVQGLFQLHPARRNAIPRLRELEAARNG